jgi:hypothetical protein
MEFVAAALNYLLGIPVLGWGTEVGFVYKGLLFLLALLIFTAYILLADRKIWAAVSSSPTARSGQPCRSVAVPTSSVRSACCSPSLIY